MRRCAALALLPVAFAVAGCGGDSGGGSSALDQALSYLPKDAPFAVAIDTNPKSDQWQSVRQVIRKFPFGEQIERQLKGQVEEGGVDFDKDIKPLLGNPFVVGGVDPRSFTSGESKEDFVGAIETKDGGKLKDIAEKEGQKLGDKDGARLYRDNRDHDVFAVDGDVLVVGGSRALVEKALDRQNSDGHLERNDFNRALEGLPKGALIRVYADVGRLIATDPGSATARKVEWVRALRTFGATGSVDDNAVTFDFRMRTDEKGLSDEDLPIAPGEESPPVIKRPGEISIGLRDAAHVIRFALAAGRQVDPASVEAGQRQIERQLGISVERDLLSQLSGNATLDVALDGSFGIRAEVADPARFKRTLAKVAPALPRIAESFGSGTVGLAKPGHGEDFYALAQPDGDSVVFGVVGRAFIVTSDPARAGRLASQTPVPVSGTSGSVVVDADAEKLAGAVLRQLSDQLGSLGALGGSFFTRPLGELTGSVRAQTNGLRGKLTLALD
jgi:Protein of unknown function (DUF3352)